ncbi:hypothetical protein BH23ACT10_BH23ACT10_24980 [soil metagenome]
MRGGFFTSRVIGRFPNEAVAAVGEGVPPVMIERAGLAAGYPAPPLQLLDELTLTLPRRIRQETQAAAQAAGDPVPTHPADPEPGTVGRPRRHGDRFACNDPATWGPPDDQLAVDDARYGTVRVQAWHGLHPKLGCRGRWADHDRPPIIAGTVIRVDVEHLPNPTSRAKKTLWLWWSGPDQPDLDVCWRAYLRRFDIEHTYRFVKNTLGWTTPSLCTPQQADRWTWLIVAAYTHLRLARGIVDDHRLPWERPRDPTRLTPARVRRGFHRVGATIGTPARPPKSDTPGPGRPRGTRSGPRTRHPTVKKTAA